MCDCLLPNSVSLSFLALSISGSAESRLSSRQDTASPTDTACSSESPAFLGVASHLLMYDQNSSEEELEVINGGGGALEASSETEGDGGGDSGGGETDCASGIDLGSSENLNRLAAAGHHQELAGEADFAHAGGDELDECTEELRLVTSPVAGTLRPLAITPTQVGVSKRCSSNNLLEKRKRSLAHSSDEEVRHLLEHQHQQQHHHHHHHHHHQPLMSAPVNFRTSPPLEALKPHRGHIIQRSTTPLILTESGRGLEHIRISSSSSISSTTSSLSSLGGASVGITVYGGGRGGLPTCDSPAVTSGISNHHHHHHHQQQQQQQCHHQPQNSSNNLALLSTTNTPTGATPGPVGMPFLGQDPGATLPVTSMEISRSVSPPAKVFHCAVSPRRRQSRHQQQRVPRPHRPCLDFDKMQQLKARSVTTWRHSNEHSGELSVFCW